MRHVQKILAGWSVGQNRRVIERAIACLSLAVFPTLIAALACAHELPRLLPDDPGAIFGPTGADPVFTALMLGAAVLSGGIAILLALLIKERPERPEASVDRSLLTLAPSLGPLAIRLGLGAMLGLSAIGGMAQAGASPWSAPSLLLPELQLMRLPGAGILVPLQAVLALMLFSGLLGRIAGLAVILLACLGCIVFGLDFLHHAAAFVAPGLILVIFGSGALSLDRALGSEDWAAPSERLARILWPLSFGIIGIDLAYLGAASGVSHSPAFMEAMRGGVTPGHFHLELALPVLAGVQLVAGLLLACRQFVRPICFGIMVGILVFTVGNSGVVMRYASILGLCALFVLSGSRWDAASTALQLKSR
ncbi:MAG: hypothetical protein AAGG56_11355 [Pseudomonadota bacterium]